MTASSRDRASLAALAARIREERGRVALVAAELKAALDRLDPAPKDVVTVHGVGGLLQDFYTGIERTFSLIAPTMNGDVPGGEAWHRDLLHAMTLDLPGLRPPVIRGETERALAEFLRFRHVYRNMYGHVLRWPRVRELAGQAVATWPSVEADLDAFVRYLDTLAAAG